MGVLNFPPRHQAGSLSLVVRLTRLRKNKEHREHYGRTSIVPIFWILKKRKNRRRVSGMT